MLRTDLMRMIEDCQPWSVTEMVDNILALLDAQRCEWIPTCSGWHYKTGCGRELHESQGAHEFCPCCGKQIEVKDAQG